jgi:uncharacterized protein YegL
MAAPPPRKHHPHARTTSTSTVATTRTITSDAAAGAARPPRVSATFVVDTSGSMCGDKTEAAFDGLRAVVADLLGPDDLVTVLSFSNDVVVHFGTRPKIKIDWDRLKRDIDARVAVGGGTALYDAIVQAIDHIPTRGKFVADQREPIVLTDGADTTGKDPAAAMDKLAHPGVGNFHAIVMSVDVDAPSAAIMGALCTPRHSTYIAVGASPLDIRKAFGKAARADARRRTIVTEIKTTTTTSTSGAAVVAAIAAAVAAAAPAGPALCAPRPRSVLPAPPPPVVILAADGDAPPVRADGGKRIPRGQRPRFPAPPLYAAPPVAKPLAGLNLSALTSLFSALAAGKRPWA